MAHVLAFDLTGIDATLVRAKTANAFAERGGIGMGTIRLGRRNGRLVSGAEVGPGTRFPEPKRRSQIAL